MYTLGIIADTHGMLRPEVRPALEGSELILHAGDIGKAEVLEELERIAPVIAVRGNVDIGEWAKKLPEHRLIEHRGRRFYLTHDLKRLDSNALGAELDVVIAGHSHQPRDEFKHGVLYFNPGSAGPRRFKLPVGLGKIYLHADGSLECEWIDLLCG